MGRPTKVQYCNFVSLVATVLITVGLTLLLYFGEHWLSDYKYTEDYITTKCTVQQSLFHHDNTCNCTPTTGLEGCRSQYPCLHIRVSYVYRKPDGRIGRHRGAYLYDNRLTFQKRDKAPYCAIFTCDKWDTYNRRMAEGYKNKYGVLNDTYSCAYHPDNMKEVLQLKTTYSQVVIAFAFSLCSLVLGFITMLMSFCCPISSRKIAKDYDLNIKHSNSAM